MKFMRLAACAVAFAVVGGMAVAEDMDIKALQAKLAAQEARLNDLQAKMGSGAAEAPASIVSMRKNAKVTIGGDLDFRYVYNSYEDMAGHNDEKADAFVDTADLRIGVAVNENFDAFMRIGSHDNNKGTGIMRDAWIRWKNICNSGWGVLVGRDGLKFGMGKPIGMWDAWIQDNKSSSGNGYRIADHLNYGVARVTQINPYWENCDGSFRFDFSVFQTLETRDGSSVAYDADSDGIVNFPKDEGYIGNGSIKRADGHVATLNYGLGSGTMKLTWKPTEDWTFVAALAHLYTNAKNGDRVYSYSNAQLDRPIAGVWSDATNSSSNTALHLGFIWNPAVFCKKLNVWAQGTQEWNTAFVKNQDFFGTNFGLSYAFTDKFTAFAQGDYTDGEMGTNDVSGYRAWVGMTYAMSNNVMLEAGYSHESIKTENAAGLKTAENKGDTLYTRLTFAF